MLPDLYPEQEGLKLPKRLPIDRRRRPSISRTRRIETGTYWKVEPQSGKLPDLYPEQEGLKLY